MQNFLSNIVPIGVILTFIGTLISIYIARKNARSTKYIDTITNERIKWIEKLRLEVADLNSIFLTIIKNQELIAELQEKFNLNDISTSAHVIRETSKLEAEIAAFSKTEILKKINTVKLRLNPVEDKNILDCLEDLLEYTFYKEITGQDIVIAWDTNSRLIALTQEMLKKEWEKAKTEARN